MEGLKIYGVCLERLRYQIQHALKRVNGNEKRLLLESYLTSDPEEIIDLLELFDITHKDMDSVMKKLQELAGDVSLLVRKKVRFDFSEEGHLCLYLLLE